MKLALLKPLVRWGYAVKGPSMGTGHGQFNDNALVLRNHLMMIKSEVGKSPAQPTTGGDQACGASEPRSGRLGSSSASRLMKSGAMIRSAVTESPVSITRKASSATCLFCSKVIGLSIPLYRCQDD